LGGATGWYDTKRMCARDTDSGGDRNRKPACKGVTAPTSRTPLTQRRCLKQPAEHHGFNYELNQNILCVAPIALRSQFPGTLGHGDEHNVHNPDAATMGNSRDRR